MFLRVMVLFYGGWLLAFQATAILYFKRFYQKWSVMEHDPKQIMWALQCPWGALGCKFIAAKSMSYVFGMWWSCTYAYSSISRVPIAKETGWSMVFWWVGRLTCIYLSCKVEEFHVSADELGKGIQQDPQVVLKNELTVLQVNDSISAITHFCSVL